MWSSGHWIKLMIWPFWLCLNRFCHEATSPRQSEQLLLVLETSWTSHWIFLLFPETDTRIWCILVKVRSTSGYYLLVCVFTVIKDNVISAITKLLTLLLLISDRLSLLADSSLWTLRLSWNNVIEMKKIWTWTFFELYFKRPLLPLTCAGASSVVLLDFFRMPEKKPPFSCKTFTVQHVIMNDFLSFFVCLW